MGTSCGVDIRLTNQVRQLSGDPRREEGGDIQLLRCLKVRVQKDGNLAIEHWSREGRGLRPAHFS